MRVILSTIAELLGCAAVITGCWLFDWRLGLVVVGLVSIVVGYVLDRPVEAAP